uniref:UPAR/Ly6 domain-containing protein n=1 Tax=Varanus komodoensis TaxID=61221 RepID=A0A8D2L3K9_VARKO
LPVFSNKNCIDEDKCNKNDTASFLGISYITTYDCCKGDFCNSAAAVPSAHISLTVALAMLGFWLSCFL